MRVGWEAVALLGLWFRDFLSCRISSWEWAGHWSAGGEQFALCISCSSILSLLFLSLLFWFYLISIITFFLISVHEFLYLFSSNSLTHPPGWRGRWGGCVSGCAVFGLVHMLSYLIYCIFPGGVFLYKWYSDTCMSIFFKILKIVFPVVDEISNASFIKHVEYLKFMVFGMQLIWTLVASARPRIVYSVLSKKIRKEILFCSTLYSTPIFLVFEVL